MEEVTMNMDTFGGYLTIAAVIGMFLGVLLGFNLGIRSYNKNEDRNNANLKALKALWDIFVTYRVDTIHDDDFTFDAAYSTWDLNEFIQKIQSKDTTP